MKHLREYLLIAAYVLLIAIVAFESFWIDNQFDNSHDDQCRIAEVQAQLAAANLALVTEPADKAKTVAVVNQAIEALNDTCGTHVPEVRPG